ncbi:MAG: DUF4124 domain-containing protein [Gammaproteobacteria bacterium]
MLKNILILVTLFGLLPLTTQAAIYKWVDENGKVVYSQQKPQNTKTEKIKVTTRVPEDSSTYNKSALKKKEADKAATDKPANNKQAANAKPEKSPKERAESCKRAQDSLQTLVSRGRIRLKDGEGNIKYMSEEEKQQRIKREQDRVKQNCN